MAFASYQVELEENVFLNTNKKLEIRDNNVSSIHLADVRIRKWLSSSCREGSVFAKEAEE